MNEWAISKKNKKKNIKNKVSHLEPYLVILPLISQCIGILWGIILISTMVNKVPNIKNAPLAIKILYFNLSYLSSLVLTSVLSSLTNSAMLTSNIKHISLIVSSLGSDRPCSHLETLCLVICNFFS